MATRLKSINTRIKLNFVILFDSTLAVVDFQTFTSQLLEESAPGKRIHDDNVFYFLNLKGSSYGVHRFSEEIDSFFFSTNEVR